jgi:hypothetical protein
MALKFLLTILQDFRFAAGNHGIVDYSRHEAALRPLHSLVFDPWGDED